MPIPLTGAVPDVVTNTLIATDWGNAIGAASKGRVVQRFNSLAERDASIAAPVPGMLCYVAATDLFYGYRLAAGWTVLIGGPRDIYHARVYRAAAFAIGTTTGVVVFDTVDRDPMGLWVPAQQGFVVPVTGVYQIAFGYSVAPVASPASGQFAAGQILVAGVVRASQGVHQSMGYGYGPNLAAAAYAVAGQVIQAAASVAYTSNGQTGTGVTYMAVDYLGTG